MSTKNRLSNYAVLAAVPVAASAGYTTADIIHYGGPAIEVNRTDVETWTDTEDPIQGRFSGGVLSAFYGNGYPTASSAPAKAGNFAEHTENTASASFLYSERVRAASLAIFNNNSVSGVEFAINQKSSADAPKFLRRFEASSSIGAGDTSFQAGVLEIAATWSTFYVDASGQTFSSAGSSGEWALDGESESRYFAGFYGYSADLEADGYGWMDIGWDGTTLTIYDWAFNTDGTIHVASIPGGSGLAALAMGAAGLRRRRKRSA